MKNSNFKRAVSFVLVVMMIITATIATATTVTQETIITIEVVEKGLIVETSSLLSKNEWIPSEIVTDASHFP